MADAQIEVPEPLKIGTIEIVENMEKYPEIIEKNNWYNCILANTKNYYNNRQVVIWGAFDTGKRIKLRLEGEGICDVIFVDSDAQKQNLDGVYAIY